MIASRFALLASLCFVTAACAEETLTVRLSDAAWNGKKVPADQVCKKFGSTNAASPALLIEAIPAGADALIVSFNDETYAPMDKGGHGVLRYAHNQSATAQLVSVPGETDNLPAGVVAHIKHRGTGWSGTGGAYLPPCSGGRGNTYTLNVAAVKMQADASTVAETLATGKITIGNY